MKQWQHIFLKYLRYEPCVVVLRCLPSKEAVGLGILKIKSEGKPMGLDLLGNFKWILWVNGCISSLEINNMQRYWSDLNVLWTPRLSFASFPRKVTHILSKYVGQYVGLDLIFCYKNVCTYIMYIHMYTPHSLQTAIYVLDPVLNISRHPPWPPLDPAPLDPQPPAFWRSLLPTKEVPHTCKIVYYF